jgi:hypothetical protein
MSMILTSRGDGLWRDNMNWYEKCEMKNVRWEMWNGLCYELMRNVRWFIKRWYELIWEMWDGL